MKRSDDIAPGGAFPFPEDEFRDLPDPTGRSVSRGPDRAHDAAFLRHHLEERNLERFRISYLEHYLNRGFHRRIECARNADHLRIFRSDG